MFPPWLRYHSCYSKHHVQLIGIGLYACILVKFFIPGCCLGFNLIYILARKAVLISIVVFNPNRL